ncbi:amino acid transporter [Nocardioides baekrokdamisoli]|uniref:Amino acid transporter n=1 Tax=Nocardioides baekrokdamisoli TaxID=1804624 RepID=A0A3G9IYY7_9ACTN|nr:amino acid transporter [Nocardioides baekrokdamisoli]BBH16558.1 amino acid transporter [Nocardioides baekrokdamisoli]
MTTEVAESVEANEHEDQHAWWRVMCLTGLDYFSTLGYAPGIAALAAGVLSPIATIVLVLLTLFGALPVYHRVAAESPHGEGSVAMLERLLTAWKGKLLVLALLGFAATSWVITMTLSAADAAAHVSKNPLVPHVIADHPELVTLALLAGLGAVFFRGFKEAIGIAVVLVGVYLVLNVVVIGDGLRRIVMHPEMVSNWNDALFKAHGNVFAMIGVAILLFPKLALGMSGFETGVAVMPQIRGLSTDTEAVPTGRISGARKLLTTAAIIMSVLLITSSFVAAILIPQSAFQEGGPAYGRALAYLAHSDLGNGFGSVYDVSTILILWFAGASAMAGMLNLIPRYLPRYGMSPEWAAATRPLVVVITAVAFFITWQFDANVDKQGGAYATGVLVLMTSAAVAVTLSAYRKREKKLTVIYGFIAAVFIYTTANNMIERPDGVKISFAFIGGIVLVSLVSRIMRGFELRTVEVRMDEKAERFVRDTARRRIRLIANEPDALDEDEYLDKLRQMIADNDLPDEDIIFVEVYVQDPSDFQGKLKVRGVTVHGHYRVLRVKGVSVANALAALTLHIRDVSGVIPHIYFEWTEGNPVRNLLRFFFLGVGEVAPTTREVLRRAEPDREKRPHVHVG